MQATDKKMMARGESGRLLSVKGPRVNSSGEDIDEPEKSMETESRNKKDVDAGVWKRQSHYDGTDWAPVDCNDVHYKNDVGFGVAYGG